LDTGRSDRWIEYIKAGGNRALIEAANFAAITSTGQAITKLNMDIVKLSDKADKLNIIGIIISIFGVILAAVQVVGMLKQVGLLK